MLECDGLKDWVQCFRCDCFCTVECPIERGDFEELVRQFARPGSIGPDSYYISGLNAPDM